MQSKSLAIVLMILGFAPAVFGAPTKSAEGKPARFELADLLPKSLQKNPRVDLSIITETTHEGKLVTPPTPDTPAYYVGDVSGLAAEEGSVDAGERSPPVKKLAETMQAALTVSGYRPATPEHPPTLFIHFRWGSWNQLRDDFMAPDPELLFRHYAYRAAIVGGTRFSREFSSAYDRGSAALAAFVLRDPETEWMVQQTMNNNLYFVIASAYEMTAANRGDRKLLWRTKMSTDSQGVAMDETLPALVRTAAPYFGKVMTEPVLLKPRIYTGRATLGEAKFIGYEEPTGETPSSDARKP